MPFPPNQAKAVFDQAVELTDPAARAAYLDRECAGDLPLRERVEALLRAHAEAGSFLAHPPAAAAGGPMTTDPPAPGPAGTVLAGRYKLLEEIGEGGMGTVWMAQQQDPVRRLVAVKLIKPGMDSKVVLARFAAERQALALMDHPNIAKVHDAGATPDGRPFFVMELVKGVPITKYCDEHHLTPRQRLELFLPVCQAVQHAHQKGVIHRDIKPSNVLVTLYDGKPVPKVIDFGVAKAAGQPLTEQTLVTGFGNIVGTLEYMSPEQAEVNQLDIDTRSDIYSLGVLLYELLTGSPPFSRKDLEKAGMVEMLRVIREQEPSKPSTKLSTADGLPTLAANRGTEPAKLTKLMRGELDWIVMKALEKDRARRYETANGFAMDVQRYLADEAVEACPPSLGYRFRKFARRNKVGLAVAALVLFFLVVLGSGTGWALRDREARAQQAAQDAARRLARTEEGIRQALERAGSSRSELHAALKKKGGVQELLNQPARWELFLRTVQAELTQARQLKAGVAGVLDPAVLRALARLEEQSAGDEADYHLAVRLEKLRSDRANWIRAEFDYRKAADEYFRALADLGVLHGSPEATAAGLAASPIKERLVAALDDWAWVAYVTKQKDLAEQLLALARRAAPDAAWGDRLRRVDVWDDREALALILTESPAVGVSPEVALLVGYLLVKERTSQVVWLRRAQAEHPTDFWLALELGGALRYTHPEEAALWCRVALAIRPTSSAAYTNLGQSLHAQGKFPEAIAACEKAIELDGNNVLAHTGLAAVFISQRKFNEAIVASRKAIEIAPNFAGSHGNLGAALHGQWIQELGKDQGKIDEAVAEFRKAIKLDSSFAPAYRNLGLVLSQKKKWGEAIDVLRKAIDLDPNNAVARRNLAIALGSLAWALATDPVPTRRDPSRAVNLAQEAVDTNPQNGDCHTTLGVALYSADRWKEAVAALEKSTELSKRPYASGELFLAMAYWKLGQKDKARAVYDRAAEWMDKHQPNDEELRRFRAEAAGLLEVKEKK